MKTKEDYKNEFWNQIISDISYNYYDDFGEDYEEQIDEWAETFANRRMKEQEENNKELTKYKKAFEILKGRKVQVYPKFDGNTQYLITLNKEEYELLEELMEGE